MKWITSQLGLVGGKNQKKNRIQKTVDFFKFNFECLVNYKFIHFLYIFEILNQIVN